MMDDSRIIELYWKRSEQAVSETALKYGNYCNAVAYRILNDRGDAEECVNDTWLRAWNSMPPHRPAALSAFLARITRNLCLNRCEKQNAAKRGGGVITAVLEELEECIPACGGVEQSVDQKMLTALLNRFLEGQNGENRRLFVLRYWYLCPVKEIAEQSGMGISKVKMRLMRMRNELKELLAGEGYSVP